MNKQGCIVFFVDVLNQLKFVEIDCGESDMGRDYNIFDKDVVGSEQ